MIRPNLLIRITGHRFLGIMFYSLSIPAIIGWREDLLPWPVALLALAVMIRVYRSMDVMHRYNRWVKEWDTLSEPDQTAVRRGEDLRYD